MRIEAIIETGIVGRLVYLLNSPNSSIQTAVLRTVGNIATGDDSQTQKLLEAGVLPTLCTLLDNSKRKIVLKEVIWTISNIAFTAEQIQAIIDAQIIPRLVGSLQSPEKEICTEATWAITNMIRYGTDAQIQYLVISADCVGPLSENVQSEDGITVTKALEGLLSIIRCGERQKHKNNGINPYSQVFDDVILQAKVIPLLNRPELIARTANFLSYFGTDNHA